MPAQSVLRRRLMALCAELRLERDERIELAEMLLKRDVASYTSLTEEEVGRLVDALYGFQLVHVLLSQRV